MAEDDRGTVTPAYKPFYDWRVTWPDEVDKNTHKTDFCGWDGEITIGRIRFEPHGPMKDTWQWTGQGPIRGLPNGRLTPHQGYAPSAREASRLVEDYYHRLMRRNGRRGSRDNERG